jgi:hypothetical protein
MAHSRVANRTIGKLLNCRQFTRKSQGKYLVMLLLSKIGLF